MQKSLDILALIFYFGLIYWLSDQSKLPTPGWFENEDKLHHFMAYFVMGVLAWRAFLHSGLPREYLIWIPLSIPSLYGVLDEWHQSFVIGRQVSAYDWLADTIGGGLATAACFMYEKLRMNLSKNI